MRKSEAYEKARIYTQLSLASAARVIELMEAAGVVWDPEEEPMAERLYLSLSTSNHHPSLWTERCGGRRADDRELGIAADLYNRRKDIAQVVHKIRAQGAFAKVSGGSARITSGELWLWVDLLEGKEKP